MILDSHGAPLKRSIGFIRRYEPVGVARALIGALYVVGVEVPRIEDDDEEADAAPVDADMRMRRAA
jgi:hypothetical protein